ncbi:MAG: hypothetical protein Q9207_001063 [Kuettlingeria erythrocarpa]
MSTTRTSPSRPDTRKPSILRSIIAGSTAGAVEIGAPFIQNSAIFSLTCLQRSHIQQNVRKICTRTLLADPLKNDTVVAKTRTQLNRRLPDKQKLGWPPFGKAWYAGCTTLIIGNSLKAGIRFVAFDTYKTLLQDEMGKISGPRTVIAGFGAGITESLLAVTPFESIKTTLIDDRKLAKPRMRGFLHGSSIIWRERGIRGFFQGFVPTTARQAANSATRFGSYTTIKQFAQGYVAPGEKLGTMSTFGIGGLAGLITVYVTQPLDTIKTRMQSIEAKKEYKNSLTCATRIFKDEGILTFWSGAVPRLARLILSGGIVFTMYEKTMEGLDTLDPERKYI